MVGENQTADVWDCLSQAFSTPVNRQQNSPAITKSLNSLGNFKRGFCHRLLVTGGDITGDSSDDQAARLLTLWTLRGPDHLHSAPRPDPPAFKFWELRSLTAPCFSAILGRFHFGQPSKQISKAASVYGIVLPFSSVECEKFYGYCRRLLDT